MVDLLMIVEHQQFGIKTYPTLRHSWVAPAMESEEAESLSLFEPVDFKEYQQNLNCS